MQKSPATDGTVITAFAMKCGTATPIIVKLNNERNSMEVFIGAIKVGALPAMAQLTSGAVTAMGRNGAGTTAIAGAPQALASLSSSNMPAMSILGNRRPRQDEFEFMESSMTSVLLTGASDLTLQITANGGESRLYGLGGKLDIWERSIRSRFTTFF